MEYGLPHFKKFPIDNAENIKLSLENFDRCPERFKEELATNIYIASLREGVQIDDNDTFFRYVDFKNELLNEGIFGDTKYILFATTYNISSKVNKYTRSTPIYFNRKDIITSKNKINKDIIKNTLVKLFDNHYATSNKKKEGSSVIYSVEKGYETLIGSTYYIYMIEEKVTCDRGKIDSIGNLVNLYHKDFKIKKVQSISGNSMDSYDISFKRTETNGIKGKKLPDYMSVKEVMARYENNVKNKKYNQVLEDVSEVYYCNYKENDLINIAKNNKVTIDRIFVVDEGDTSSKDFFKNKEIGEVIENNGEGYYYCEGNFYYYHHEDTPVMNYKKPLNYSKLYSEGKKISLRNESCVASLALPDAQPFEDNKYIDRTEIDDEPNERFDFNNIFMESSIIEEEQQVLTEAPANSKRKQIEAMIYEFFSTIDITGANTKKYKEMFSKMTDEQFNKYMKKFLYDDSMNFYLEVLPNKNEPTLKLIKKCADKLGIPLDEYVYYRHDGDKDKPIRTSYKVPVGNLILKRMQQTLSKKNTYSLSISSRNMKTGTVTGHDKIA